MIDTSNSLKIGLCAGLMMSVTAPCVFAAEEQGAGTMFASSLKALGALVLVLAIILIVAWLVKRYLHIIPQGMTKGDTIKVVAYKAIGPKKAVHLIEVEDQKILIGSTEGGITLLKEFSADSRPKP